MTSLIGLAFTSPQLAVMVCDRDKFRVHYYQNRPSELHAFLGSEDTRLPVVLVKSLRDLERIKDVEGMHAILLFDEPDVMSSIEGVNMLDAEEDSTRPGYRKVLVPQERLNSVLLEPGSFTLSPDAKDALSRFSSEVSFRNLVKTVTGSTKLPDDFLDNVCLYLVGCLTKKSWVSRCQKVGLSAGISVELMAELEKYIEFSSDPIWRAWYDINEKDVPVKDAASQFEADIRDVNYVISILGKREGLKYSRNPHMTPLVVKKKRKKKLTPSQLATKKEKYKGGPTVTSKLISPIDEDLLMEAQKEDKEMSDNGFPLIETLKTIDEATKGGEVPYAFSRMACARICGLVRTRSYNVARAQAVTDGASEESIESIRKYILKDPSVQNIWKAYCKTSYVLGVSMEEAAEEFSVPLPTLKAIMAYKPMAFMFDYVKWPEEIEK